MLSLSYEYNIWYLKTEILCTSKTTVLLLNVLTGSNPTPPLSEMTPVSSGQIINDEVGVFQWKFYTFAVPPQGTHSLSVSMKTIGNGVST